MCSVSVYKMLNGETHSVVLVNEWRHRTEQNSYYTGGANTVSLKRTNTLFPFFILHILIKSQ